MGKYVILLLAKIIVLLVVIGIGLQLLILFRLSTIDAVIEHIKLRVNALYVGKK